MATAGDVEPAGRHGPGGARQGHAALAASDVAFSYRPANGRESVTFRGGRGRCAALLAPTGAAKTTLFSLRTRLLVARQGRIEICGRDVRIAGARALAPLGIVFQQPTLDTDLTARQNLHYFARL